MILGADPKSRPAWTSAQVGRHLQGSRKFIIICSPHARASSFVNDEIQRFTQVHSAEDLIPVLIAGSPETTNAADDTDTAFPACKPGCRSPRAELLRLA